MSTVRYDAKLGLCVTRLNPAKPTSSGIIQITIGGRFRLTSCLLRNHPPEPLRVLQGIDCTVLRSALAIITADVKRMPRARPSPAVAPYPGRLTSRQLHTGNAAILSAHFSASK
jgi:hypothetical protein